jgi:uncharacterized phiE125 gp8 family phage protein
MDRRYSLSVTTPPAGEPLTLADAKGHMREDGTDQDVHIAGLIAAVRRDQEDRLGVALITQTMAMRMDRFPALLELPRSPVQSVTSIQYVDLDGVTQTLAGTEYTADLYSTPPRIVPAYGKSWPSTRAVPNAVTVTFVAGFGDSSEAVPDDLRTALLMRLADLYENREAKITGTIVAQNQAADQLECNYQTDWF